MNNYYYEQVARTLNRLTTVLALLLLVIPSVFFTWNTYSTKREQLDAWLLLQARIVEEFIQRDPDHWEDTIDRLRARLEPFVVPGESVELKTAAGRSLATFDESSLAWPTQSHERTVHLFGEPVARLVGSISHRAAVENCVVVFLFSAGIAWALWGPGRRIPLRALLNSETELRTYHENLEALVETRTAELAASRDAAEKARVIAETANRAKSAFLSHMSHELRTPLNAILGFGQLLEMDQATLDPSQADSVREIVSAGEHLLTMVNEILDLARIESGRLEVHPAAITLAPIVSDCLAQLRPIAARRAVVVEQQVAATLTAWADGMRVKQVLLNLLANAVKYNREAGRVVVSAATTGAHLRLEVSDTGPGIATEYLPLLFRPFERLGGRHHANEGTGIGLALVRKLVTAMRGEVGVDSTLGVGSVFWFTLPLTPPNPGDVVEQATLPGNWVSIRDSA